MTRSILQLTAVSVVIAVVPLAAQAALFCSAETERLDFGEISVLDSASLSTSGQATVSCSGGEPNTFAQVYMTTGSNDGRNRVDGTLRYMIESEAEELAYSVTSNSGQDVVSREFQLDENGSAAMHFALDAKVTSIGSEVVVGNYGSEDHVTLRYCESAKTVEGECNETGSASSFAVEAIVSTSCTIIVSNLDFGNIDPAFVEPVDQIATISVTCTNASPYAIGLTQGNHFVNSGPTGRRMANGSHLLAYGLYLDPARSESWGQEAGTVASGMGTGGVQPLTVFGRVFPNQTAFVGAYSDTVVVIITY